MLYRNNDIHQYMTLCRWMNTRVSSKLTTQIDGLFYLRMAIDRCMVAGYCTQQEYEGQDGQAFLELWPMTDSTLYILVGNRASLGVQLQSLYGDMVTV